MTTTERTAIDPLLLAKAMRTVERLRAEQHPEEDWSGPPPEWYDEYAEMVVEEYRRLEEDRI